MGWLNLHENCQTRKLISRGKNIRFIASIKPICILKYDFLQFHSLKWFRKIHPTAMAPEPRLLDKLNQTPAMAICLRHCIIGSHLGFF